MLPFSSITSIVPLFILAFAYCVYFGASLLNRNAPQAIDTPADKVIARAETGYSSVNYPDYRQASDDQPAESVPYYHDIPLRDISNFIHESPHGKPAPLHPVSQFSPRPPPHIRKIEAVSIILL